MSFLYKHLALIAILFATGVFIQFVGIAYIPLLPVISDDFSVSSHVTQLAVAIYLGGFMCIQIFAAYMSDQMGRRKIFILGSLFALLGCFLCYIAGELYLLFIFLFITAIGVGLMAPIINAIVSDVFKSEQESSQVFGIIGGRGDFSADIWWFS